MMALNTLNRRAANVVVRSPISLSALAIVTWQMGLALPMLLCLTDVSGIGHIQQDWLAAIGLAIGLGVPGTGVSFLLYYFLLHELGAVAASGAVYTTPVVALLIGWVAGERVGLLELLAVILIFGSIAMLEVGRQQTIRGKAESIKGPIPQ